MPLEHWFSKTQIKKGSLISVLKTLVKKSSNKLFVLKKTSTLAHK